jgi:hypothetical protein
MNRISKFLLLLLTGISIAASAQEKGEIKGVVRDGVTGEPIISATIYVVELETGTNTDFDGFFAMSDVPIGTYTVRCTYLGYDSLISKVKVVKGKTDFLELYLTPRAKTLKAAVITDKLEDKSKATSVGSQKITPREINLLPSVGGSQDLAQYLQVLPGVVFTGDQGGQLYIRGGSPVMNKILLDGMTIYNPFHSIGLFSVFDSDLIKTADVYSAGFGAEYGGRISAIVDVKTRDGNRNRPAGNVSVGPFLSKFSFEGPLKKFKQGQGHSSYMFSIRNSYLEQSSKLFYSYTDVDRLPYNFNDIYGKMSFVAPNGSSFKMFGFRFDDKVNFAQTQYHWLSTGFGGRFVFIPEESKTKIDGFLSYSDYKINQTEADNLPRESGINGFNLGINFTYYFKNDELRYGIELNGFQTNFELFNSNNRRITQTDNTTEIAGFALYKYKRNRFLADIGLRSQFYASLGNAYLEPRLALKYNITTKLRVKGATGLYSQNLLSANSDRDVVNLFYGFLSGPDNIPRTFDGNEVTHRMQTAWHGVFGFEYEFSKSFEVELEGYYKGFTQLTNINRDKLFDDNSLYAEKPDRFKKDFIVETGEAYGADISFKYTDAKWYLWGVYSLNFVNRFDGHIEYPTHWDRRHNVNLLAAVTPDKKEKWQISLRWNFGSGFPFTQSIGYYEKLDFQQGGLGTNYMSQNGDLGILYGDLNGGRLPYYHRLDFSAQYTLAQRKNFRSWLVFSITNIYDRNNIFYFDRASFNRVDQLPFMPSLSWNAKF